MLRADKLAGEGDVVPAADLYREAVAAFERVREADPAYKPDVIARRVGYCRERLAALPEPEPEVPMVEAAALEAERARGDRLEEQVAALEGELGKVRADLEAARKEQPLAARRIGELEAEMARREAQWSKQVESLRARLAAAADALAEEEAAGREAERAREEAARELVPLRSDNERLAARVARLEDLAREARGSWAAERRSLREQIRDGEREVKQLREAVARLEDLQQRAAVPARPEAPPPPPAAPVSGMTVREQLAQAEGALRAGEVEQAEELFRGVTDRDPGNAAARFGMARIQLQRGDVAAARKTAEGLTREQPDVPGYWHFLGTAAARMDDRRMALKALERCSELMPDNPLVYRDLAAAYYAVGRRAEAIGAFRRVVELQPDDGKAHFNLAALLVAEGPSGREEASMHYGKALELGEPRDEAMEGKLRE